LEAANDQPVAGETGTVQQAEMPFAVVQGQPYTQLPKDLYIPPEALEVFLEAFEGPLDLLLYLIRRQNLDILDIPIAEITTQYMAYIGMLDESQFELAAEYLVMAAILAEATMRMRMTRVRNSYAACRNTNDSRKPPKTWMNWRGKAGTSSWPKPSGKSAK
jgi:segregation and condensation protein A